MLYTSKIEIETVTPLNHFKFKKNSANQLLLEEKTKEGLRATELKPRFINFIVKEIPNDKLSKELRDLKYIDLTHMIVIQVENNLNVSGKHTNLTDCGLNNLTLQRKDETGARIKGKYENTFLEGTTMVKLGVKGKYSNENIFKEVVGLFENFIGTHAFGTRKYKGYGSFKVLGKGPLYLRETKFEKVILESKTSIENLEGKIIKEMKTSSNLRFYARDYSGRLKCNTEEQKDELEDKLVAYLKFLLGSTTESVADFTPNEDDTSITEVEVPREGKKYEFKSEFQGNKKLKSLSYIPAPYRVKFVDVVENECRLVVYVQKEIRYFYDTYRNYAKDTVIFDLAVLILEENLNSILSKNYENIN